jgi:hypothetical protein
MSVLEMLELPSKLILEKGDEAKHETGLSRLLA